MLDSHNLSGGFESATYIIGSLKAGYIMGIYGNYIGVYRTQIIGFEFVPSQGGMDGEFSRCALLGRQR